MIRAFLSFLVFYFVSVPGFAQNNNTKPNIIFIFADDLGWGDLGCYGNTVIKTPNIDGLAKEGILFTQFYVSGSVCSPSRAAIMTGQYPARLGIHGHFASSKINSDRGMPDFMDANIPTLTKILKTNGYTTAHFGKWHLGGGAGAPNLDAYGIDVHKADADKDPAFDIWSAAGRPTSSKQVIDETIRFLDEHKDNPFYVNVWFSDPHATLNPSEEQMEQYRHTGPGKTVPHRGATEIYYATVTEMDKQIGRLMDALKEKGLSENTMIIFSSDNGPEDIHIANASHSAVGSAGPFRGRKRSLYEGGVRVPFIVRWPSGTPSGKVDTISVIAGVDFIPSLTKLAGAILPANIALDGEDMSSSFIGKPRLRKKALIWEWRYRIFGEPFHRSPMLSIRQGKWKLLFNPDRSRVELYDIPKDPTEMNNLAAANAAVVKELSKKALAWQSTLHKSRVEPVAGSNSYPWPKAK